MIGFLVLDEVYGLVFYGVIGFLCRENEVFFFGEGKFFWAYFVSRKFDVLNIYFWYL